MTRSASKFGRVPSIFTGTNIPSAVFPPTEVADGQVKLLLSGSLDEEMDEIEDGEIVDEEEEREEAGEVNETEDNRTIDGEDGEFEEGEIVEEEEELYEDEEITDGENKDGDQIVPTRPGKLVSYPDSDSCDSSDTIINPDNPV